MAFILKDRIRAEIDMKEKEKRITEGKIKIEKNS